MRCYVKLASNHINRLFQPKRNRLSWPKADLTIFCMLMARGSAMGPVHSVNC